MEEAIWGHLAGSFSLVHRGPTCLYSYLPEVLGNVSRLLRLSKAGDMRRGCPMTENIEAKEHF